MDEVRWLDEREARAWRGLQFMQMQLEAELARQLTVESDLSYPDYSVLVALTGKCPVHHFTVVFIQPRVS